MRTFEAEFTIFTDGSTSGKQERGGAGVYVESKEGGTILEACFAAGQYCSSYTGECVGLLEALRWIKAKEDETRPTRVLICTDSMSLAQALKKNDWKDKDLWVKQIKDLLFKISSEVTLLWVPAHCDISGNEKLMS